MSFICPRCNTPGGLGIVASLQLPPNNRSDDIFIQAMKCHTCGLLALGIYEESRRGKLRAESWDHQGFYVNEEAYHQIIRLIKQCPEPFTPGCQCKAHSAFSETEWQNILPRLAIDLNASFPIHLG